MLDPFGFLVEAVHLTARQRDRCRGRQRRRVPVLFVAGEVYLEAGRIA